jgi:hypothetical protein
LEIAKPMTRLLEKGKDFEWTKDFTTTPILILPDIMKKFDIYCNAS